MYLIVPTLFVELLIGARNKKFVLLSLIAMTCYSISTVSRAVWAFFCFVYIVYCFIIWKKNILLSKKVKRMMKYGVVLIILLCVIII